MRLPTRAALTGALLVVLLLVCLLSFRGEAARALPGFWAADPAFLEEAGLQDMFLQISPLKDGQCSAFLIMAVPPTEPGASGDLICNQALVLWPGRGITRFRPWRRKTYRSRAVLEFDDPGAAPLPENMRLALNPVEGSLSLYDGEKIFGFFFKDHSASASIPPDEEPAEE